MSNHIATNLVTKGLLNISDITKGMISITGYQIVTKRRGGGSSYDDVENYPIFKKINDKKELFNEIKNQVDEIDYIKVEVDWFREHKYPTLIEVKLIKSFIEAEILNETGKNIRVELL